MARKPAKTAVDIEHYDVVLAPHITEKATLVSEQNAVVFKVALDGKVLGVIGKSGRELKEFSGAHAIACPSENLIYAAETANWRVQKLILRPAAE